jgi:ABC-type amino acid transport substrate-binding protein
MTSTLFRKVFWSLGLLIIGACATPEPPPQATQAPAPGPPPLRIGVTPGTPPMIFKSPDGLMGLEADFARLLGRELGRPVEFVELEWDKQIPALLEGRTDIIMSNMTITAARQVRIVFTDAYVRVALVAVMRANDKAKFSTWDDILSTQGNVGVVPNTTGDAYVQRNMPYAVRVEVPTVKDAALQLERRRIDLLVHDGPVAMWMISENEADLVGFSSPLEEQDLGWGVRRGDQALLSTVNGVLAKWKRDGTLDNALDRWMPWRKARR